MVNKTHELYKNIWWFRKKVVPLHGFLWTITFITHITVANGNQN